MLASTRRMFVAISALLFMIGLMAPGAAAGPQFSGAIYTSKGDGTIVDQNLYASKPDVYLNGGPQNLNAPGLPNGTYYFQITDPSGKTLLSTDNAVCRQLLVVNGRISGATGSCPHANGTLNTANGSTPVQLIPFDDTPNNGGEYKAWLISKDSAIGCGASKVNIAADQKHINFPSNCAKTDNFKVRKQETCADNPHLAGCPVQMPIRKTIDGRPITCADTQAPVINGNLVTHSLLCKDDPNVIGSLTVDCTFITGVAPTPQLVSCTNQVVNNLPQFTTRLYTDFVGGTNNNLPGGGPDGQPDKFINGSCSGTELPTQLDPTGCIGTALIPPENDPFLPSGMPVVGCEVGMPAGWYLPDDGVITDPDPGAASNPTVFDKGSARCFQFTIPVASDLFEIFINNVPVGTINISKTSHGGEGTFNYTTTGSANSDCNTGTLLTPVQVNSCTTGGLPATPPGFSITTSNGAGSQSFVVGARTLFPTGYDPYGINETADPAWTQFIDPNCDFDPTLIPAGLGFGLIPGGTQSCAFTNYKNACTYTQGGWGAPRPGGDNPVLRLVNNFVGVYPNGVKVGNGATADNLTVTGPNGLLFTSAPAIQAFLPAGGPAGVLGASATDPTSTVAGVFAGQVLTLQLNVDFSLAGLFQFNTLPSLIVTGTGFPSLDGQSVAHLLWVANRVLSGASEGGFSSSNVSALNDIVNKINNAYDNCRVNTSLVDQIIK